VNEALGGGGTDAQLAASRHTIATTFAVAEIPVLGREVVIE